MEALVDDWYDEEVFEEDQLEYENEEIVPKNRKIKVEIPLINDDYNLNSPIMTDIIDNIINYSIKGLPAKHHKNRTERIWKPFKNNSISVKHLHGVDKSYYHIIQYLKSRNIKHSSYVENLIKIIDTEVQLIKDVADMFVEAMGVDPIKIDLKQTIIDDPNLVELMFKINEINLISECMVSKGKRFDIKNYERSFKFETLNDGLIRFATTNFQGYMTSEIVYDTSKNVLFDKNLILMIKDILTGRFNTTLLIALDLEKKYSHDILAKFWALLDLGDELIRKVGNEAYDSIALLEPFCVNRIQELADSTRPRIIIPKDFSNYINNKVLEATPNHREFLEGLKILIDSIASPTDLTIFYGSFRLWGHPYIEYEIGLEKLKTQVRMEKPGIDEDYANLLANDLMKEMLLNHFKANKTWNVKDNDHNRNIPGVKPLIENLWPKPKDFQQLETHWHELEIEPILEIPEDIDDSTIFSDKTHSLNKDEILKYKKRDSTNPIPTKRVLKSYIESSRINLKDFIMQIDKNGLLENDLVIGLKAKERELKRFGRFFTLMTWNLRLYFVISEYMIKKNFIKVFDGLTMSDGFIDLINKVLDRTAGQRGFDYENVTYANHIDYSKWNNHQRDKAVRPVFKVMDKCYGLNNFISRTHDFFEKCMVYYPERPEFITVESPFFWSGQPGGFEGIRQKGWSVVGILSLIRECKFRNTKVDKLVQGDNQLVFTHYKLPKKLKEDELMRELDRIYNNNNQIMKRVKIASEKLGLIINSDETVQSAGFSIYGKMPIYKGNILNLETKKVNRMSGITNDQLPTCANIMSSVNSTALAICQNDPMTRNAVYIHLVYGVIVLNSLKLWNPMGEFGENLMTYTREALAKWLYHDQCMGGNTGMPLTKFLIRRFPDPITESLSFYKYIAEKTTDRKLSSIMWMMGNPIYKRMSLWAFNKLLEDPTSLNIEKGSNIAIMIKNQVKNSLIKHSDNIKNEVLRKSLNTLKIQEEYVLTFLKGIKPVFPRFLSDFKQSSVCGYIDGVVGLVQNSKTIRTMFSHEFESKVRDTVRRWELEQWQKLQAPIKSSTLKKWLCSSTQADYLRYNSWGMDLLGATVPHPFEYQRGLVLNLNSYVNSGKKEIITCLVPKIPIIDYNNHGGITPYLGSNTKESSNAIQPWEKELTNPIFRKASNLRRGINWIMAPDSKLAKSIYSNLNYMTNHDLSGEISKFKKLRTGTALHRYKTNRQDNGGFCNITPNVLSWFIVTSDYMTDLSDVNYDFMYQASLIFTETIGAHILTKFNQIASFGMGISCRGCIRPLKELTLESSIVYRPQIIAKTFWINKIHLTDIISNEDILRDLFPYTEMEPKNIHYVWGVHQALGTTLKYDRIDDNIKLSELYSIGAMMKIRPRSWILGIIDGFLISSAYSVLNSDAFLKNQYHFQMIRNRAYRLIKRLSADPNFFPILKLNNISDWLITDSNYISPSYPPSGDNHSRSFSSHAFDLVAQRLNDKHTWIKTISNEFIIFNEFDSDKFKLMLLMGIDVLKAVSSDKPIIGRFTHLIKIANLYRDTKLDPKCDNLSNLYANIGINNTFISISTQESRVPLEKLSKNQDSYVKINEYEDHKGYELRFLRIDSKSRIENSEKSTEIECPFISGIRAYRCATGAHYKMNDMLNMLNIIPQYCLVGGDGSGGMSALVLRKYKGVDLIFNSLMEYDDIILRGSSPGRPQAISSLNAQARCRCLNLNDCWMEASDLTEKNCWDNFRLKTEQFGSSRRLFDLIILDMEARTLSAFSKIYHHLMQFIRQGYLMKGGYTITKCYTGMISEIVSIITEYDIPIDLMAVNGRFTSSYSTEIYLIMRTYRSFPATLVMQRVNSVSELNFSLQTDEQEFKRGMKLDVRSLYNYIPHNLRENYESYLTDYLLSISITPSLGVYMISLIMSGSIRSGLSELIYYSTIAYGDNQDIVSSDQVLIKLTCFLIGLSYYLAVIRNNIQYYLLGNHLNNSMVLYQNSKVEMICSIHPEGTRLSYSKSIGPVRDNSLVNLILRSLLGCHYTVSYEGQIRHNRINKKFTTNIPDLFE